MRSCICRQSCFQHSTRFLGPLIQSYVDEQIQSTLTNVNSEAEMVVKNYVTCVLVQWLTSCVVFLLFLVFFNRGDFGRLGHGNSSDLFIPHPIMAIKGLEIKQIACGDSHCLAITADGDVHRCSYLSHLLTLTFDIVHEYGLINLIGKTLHRRRYC